MFDELTGIMQDIKTHKLRTVIILVCYPVVFALMLHFILDLPLDISLKFGGIALLFIIPIGLMLVSGQSLVALIAYIHKKMSLDMTKIPGVFNVSDSQVIN